MKVLYLCFLVLPFVGRSQQGFVMNGSLTGLTDKSNVSLVNANDPTDTIAQAPAKGGKFVLKGAVPEPGLYTLNFDKQQKKGLLFLDNSNIAVTGSVDNIQKLAVTGSPSNKDFEELQHTFNPMLEKLNQLSQQAAKTGATPAMRAEGEAVTAKIQTAVDQFIQQKKSSYVTPFLILVTAQLSENSKQPEARLASLPDQLQKGYYGMALKDMIEKSKLAAGPEVGTTATDFTQNDPDGKPVTLSSFKGKYVLIDFWASWCGPCRQENPNVVRTYQKFKDKNFTVLGISLDQKKDSWLKAIKDDKLLWTQVSDLKYWNNEVAQKYKIQQIPQNFLIDPKGIIIARDLRGDELSEKLAQLLK